MQHLRSLRQLDFNAVSLSSCCDSDGSESLGAVAQLQLHKSNKTTISSAHSARPSTCDRPGIHQRHIILFEGSIVALDVRSNTTNTANSEQEFGIKPLAHNAKDAQVVAD